ASLACQRCDPKATCSLAADQAHCVCPPDTNDVSGDGTSCQDKCTQAGCSPNASCHLEGNQAKCACNAGFTGDGVSCVRDPACADLGCASVASCERVSGTLSCACPQGFQGNGVGANGCRCAPNYTPDANGWCIHERSTNCISAAPPHATASVVPVTITYSDAGGWSTPATCAWACQRDYAKEGGGCINTKVAACTNQAPANANSTPAEVVINYTTAGGWSAPAACAWSCKAGFVRTGDTCTAAPCQRTSASADAYVDPVSGVDDQLHGNGPNGCAFRTIPYALLLAGGTIRLAGGTHSITQTLIVSAGQQLLCDVNNRATLDGQPNTPGGDVGYIGRFASGTSMRNCNAQGKARGVCFATDGAVTLHNNRISNCGGAAIHATGNGLVVTENVIQNASTNVFFQFGGSATISRNTFSATNEDVGCNVLTSITGTANTHPGGVVTCRAQCGCPAGF
ncbi:MAG TPA: EGF domain-containing protein, partial [Polyangiales bacterium]